MSDNCSIFAGLICVSVHIRVRNILLIVLLGLSVPTWGQSKLSAPITYSSKDSMVMTGKGDAYLHGNGKILYEEMELESD